MINRREVLKIGGGLLMAAPLSAIKLPFQFLIDPDIRAGRVDVVADTTSAYGRQFIATAHMGVASAVPLTLDETSFFNQLDAHWSAGTPRPLFGLTRSSIAILVEALARNHGMAVTFRGWHDARPGGATHHVLYGDSAAIGQLKRDLVSSRGGWAPILGGHVERLTAPGIPPGSENFEVMRRNRPDLPGRLVSWAVAPLGLPGGVTG
jgi:hypothetical protein